MGSDSLTTALIDADVLVYQAGYFAETWVDFDGDGIGQAYADIEMAKSRLQSDIDEIMRYTNADVSILCLSDPDNNFRKQIDPTYKAMRAKSVTKPILLAKLREWITGDIGVVQYPHLEGDDVMGILQGQMKDSIIVSIDKDMKTIPGRLFNPQKKELGIVTVTEEEADRFHLFQTLMGDSVDEYKGCPGIGPKKAAKALDCDGPHWPIVVALFEQAGLTEADALVQARLAHILRAGDYDHDNLEVTLWTP